MQPPSCSQKAKNPGDRYVLTKALSSFPLKLRFFYFKMNVYRFHRAKLAELAPPGLCLLSNKSFQIQSTCIAALYVLTWALWKSFVPTCPFSLFLGSNSENSDFILFLEFTNVTQAHQWIELPSTYAWASVLCGIDVGNWNNRVKDPLQGSFVSSTFVKRQALVHPIHDFLKRADEACYDKG